MNLEKFEKEDLPVILATLKRALEAKMPSRLMIDISKEGGVIGIILESKMKVK